MFQEPGPDARELFEVIAFFPQGINENDLDWLFPATPNKTNIFDTFCILSLAYRSDEFITMLAPLRDHLHPKDPASCLVLHATKDRYCSRLSVGVGPDEPGFGEALWIRSEDVNVEHLLDVFTSTDANSAGVWDAFACFIGHLSWHKTQLVVLGQRLKRSQTTTSPTQNACSSSRGYSTQLEIMWSTNGPSFTPPLVPLSKSLLCRCLHDRCLCCFHLIFGDWFRVRGSAEKLSRKIL